MNEVLKNIHARRSVRAFADKAIPRAILQDILQAGLSAPSAMNNQLWQLTAVSNPDRLTGLQHAVQTVLNRPDYGKFYGAATLVLVSVPRDYAHGIADTACVLENIFLAACSLGVGSVWINQFKNICDEPVMRQALTACQVPENHVIWGAAALGYGEPKSATRENKGKLIYID